MKILLIVMFFSFILSINAQSTDSQNLNHGIQLFEEGKLQEAKKVFSDILEKDEEIAQAQYFLGFTYFRLGELDDAIDHCEEAVELEPNNPDYHFKLGQLYGEDAKDASVFRLPFVAGSIKEQFETAIALDPRHLGGHIGLAQFYFQAPGIVGGDIDKAIDQAKIVIKLDEKEGRLLLATIYTSEENFVDAEIQLKSLEEKYGDDKNFFYLYNTYGYLLLGQSRIDEAIEKFEKQVELAPEQSNPHDSLGEALRAKGLLQKSLSEYKKALQLSPNNERIQNIISEIESEIKSK